MIDFYGTSEANGTTTGRLSTAKPKLAQLPRTDSKIIKSFTRATSITDNAGGEAAVEVQFNVRDDGEGYALIDVVSEGAALGTFYAGRTQGELATIKSVLQFLMANMPVKDYNGEFMAYRFTLADGRLCSISGTIFSEKFQQAMAKRNTDKTIYRVDPFMTSVVVTDEDGDITYRRKSFGDMEAAIDYGQCVRAFFFARPCNVDDFLDGEDEDIFEFLEHRWGDNSGTAESPIRLTEHLLSKMSLRSSDVIPSTEMRAEEAA